MTLLWLYLLIAAFGAWAMLRLLANERQQRRSYLEYHQQVRLYNELRRLKQQGRL